MDESIENFLKNLETPKANIGLSEQGLSEQGLSEQGSNIESTWDCDKSTCMCKCHSDKCEKCSSVQPISLVNGCNELICECICHECSEECDCCCHETVCFCDNECNDPKCLCECHDDSENENGSETPECTEDCGDCYDDFTIECACECHKDEYCDCDEDCDIHKCNCRVCKDLAKFFVDDNEVDANVEAFETSKCECDLCKEIHTSVHNWDNWEPSTKLEEILKNAIDKSQGSADHFETARRYLQGLPQKDLNKPLD